MPLSLNQKQKRYDFLISPNFQLPKEVKNKQWQGVGKRDGPFSNVPTKFWDAMRKATKEKANDNALIMWANKNYNRGPPIASSTLGHRGITLGEFGKLLETIRQLTKERDEAVGILPMNDSARDEPLPPKGIPDVVIPTLPRGTGTDRCLWIEELKRSKTVKGKLAYEIMETVSNLRRNYELHDGSKLKIDFLRKHFGLQRDNDKYHRHIQGEIRRLKMDSDETHVKSLYTAVYRKFAGFDVGTYELYGCDVAKLLEKAINKIKSSPQGKLTDSMSDLMASCQAKVLFPVLSDPAVAKKVLVAAERLRTSSRRHLYSAKKIHRIREGKEVCCMVNCPFCKCTGLEESSHIKVECMEILLFLLSELAHMGTDGEEKKKLCTHNGKKDGVVLHPAEYNEDHFKVQDPILAIICKAGHRIQTDLMNSNPKEQGYRSVPEDYTFKARSTTTVGIRGGFQDAIYDNLHLSSSHNKCVVQGGTAEFWRHFRNCLDSHHTSRGINVELPCEGIFDAFNTVTVEQMKFIELSQAPHLITGGNIDDIVEGVACEFLLVRSFLCSFHHLWHFLHHNRDEPELKSLFEEYPFEDEKKDDGTTTVTRYTGTLNQLLEGLKIEKSEFKAAFDASGRCELPRSSKFKEAVNTYYERKKLHSQARRATAATPQTRRSSDEEGNVEPATAAAVKPQWSEEDEEEDLFADDGAGLFELDDLSEGEQLEEANFCRNVPVSEFLKLDEKTTQDLIDSIEWCEENGHSLFEIDEEDDEDDDDDEDNHDEAGDSRMTKPVYAKFGADGRLLPEPRRVQRPLPRFQSNPPDSKRLKSEEE